MTDILEKWLLNSIGVNISLSSGVLGEACFDGTLYAKILLKYSVCNHAYIRDIPKTTKYKIAYNNLKKLCVWFKLLGISYNDKLLEEIASKQGSSALRLLYELFTKLENRETMRYVDAKKKERLLSESTDKFSVKRAPEPKPKQIIDVEKQYLRESIAKGRELITRFIEKDRSFIDKCFQQSKERRNVLKEKLKSDRVFNQFAAKFNLQDQEMNKFNLIDHFEEQLNKQEHKEVVKHLAVDRNEFVSRLKSSRKKSEAGKSSREKMMQETLDETWRELLKGEELTQRESLAKKLLKQCYEEKQMVLRLQRSRDRYKKFIENRKLILETEQKQKYASDFKESFRILRDEDANRIENLRIQELHNKLIFEKNRIKFERDYRACQSIFYDLVDFAIVMQEYKKEFKIEPSKKRVVGWKLMFIKGMPIFECGIREAKSLKEGVLAEDKCSETLAEYEFHLYNCLLGPWNPNQFPSLSELYQERLDKIGNVVHRLLDLKYKYEMSFGVPAEVPKYNIQVLLRGVRNSYIMEKLKRFLRKAKIEIIDVNTAVNYAINAYNKHITANNLQKNMSCFRRKIYTLLTHAPSALANTREEKKALFLDKITSKKPVKESEFQDVGFQFPSNIEIVANEENKELPRVVALGRLVECYLNEGFLLSDVLTSLIILEYIKSLSNINGWILINFPFDLVQAGTLEYLFSGREVPFKKHIDDRLWYEAKKEFTTIEDEINLMNSDPLEKCKINEENVNRFSTKSTQMNNTLQDSYVETRPISIHYVDPSELMWPQAPVNLDNDVQMRTKRATLCDIFLAKHSNILPKPYPDAPLPPFKSIFTKVIPVNNCLTHKQNNEESEDEEIERIEVYEGVDDEWLEVAKMQGLFNSESVNNFYKGLGILYPFSYEKLTPDILMDLGRIILNKPVNEGDFAWTNSIDVFGFDMLCQMKPKRFLHETELCPSQNNGSFEDLFSGPVYHRPSLELLTKILFEDEPNTINGEPITVEIKNDSEPHSDSNNLSMEQSIPKEYYEPLASLWETTEYFYVNNLSEVFNFLRLVDSQLYPYTNFVINKSDQCTSLSDDRKRIVSNFQVMLNSIRADLRQVKSMKNELHCRVYELQHNLWKLADIKKLFSEEILRAIKKENWLPKRLCIYLKGYSFSLQAEADRFINTMQLLTDYYSLISTGQPSGKQVNRILLPIFEWDRNQENDSKKSVKHGQKVQTPQKKTIPFKHNSFPKSNNFSSSLEDSVIYCSETMEKNTLQSLELLTIQVENLKSQVNAIRDFCKSFVEETFETTVNIKDQKLSQVRASRTSTLKQKQGERNYTLFLEWGSALGDETDRALFRIELINARASAKIQEQISSVESVFQKFELEVLEQHHKERMNIDKLCDLFRVAIEEEVKIQPAIVLDKDKFYLDPDKLMYPSPPPPPPTILEEICIDHQFTVYQLYNLLNKMAFTAPLGVPKGAFVYILQDMACLGHELGYPYLPPIWSSFTSETISNLLDKLFGDRPFICWQSFIIFSLDLVYPSLEMIVDMKKQFEAYDPERSELITEEQLMNTLLWFEHQEGLGLEETLRSSKIKNLFFKLFQVNEIHMNYTCFLLFICKGANLTEGFVKAIVAVDGFLTAPWKLTKIPDIKKEEVNNNIINSILQEILDYVYQVGDIINQDKYAIEEPNLYEFLPEFEHQNEVTNSLDSTYFVNKTDINKFKDLEEVSDAEYELKRNESTKNLDWQNCLTNFSPISSFLEFDIHFDTIISLLIFYLQYYAVYPCHSNQQLSIEKRLNSIFSEKGDGYTMKLGTLLEDEFIKEVLTSYRIFKPIKMSQYLNLQDKEESTIAQEYCLHQ